MRLWYGLGGWVNIILCRTESYPAGYDWAPPNRTFHERLFNSQNFAGSAASAEVCALLRVILVCYNYCNLIVQCHVDPSLLQ